MAIVQINTNDYLFFRKDIIASTYFTLQEKMILSTLIVVGRKTVPEITNDYLCRLYGLADEEVESAVSLLEQKGFITRNIAKVKIKKYLYI